MLVLLPGLLLAVVASSRARGLTRAENALALAASDGRRLVWVLAACGLVAAASAFLLTRIERRVSLGTTPRRVLGATILVVACLGAIGTTAHYGGPATMWHRAVHSFERPPTRVGPNLNQRLFQLSGTGRTQIWRVAVKTYDNHPALGVGAGSFERYWQRDPSWAFTARDAHSLYLEALAELGPLGLVLVVGALLVPLAACIATRRTAVVPAAAGAYVAFLVHAGFDWDWELAGVTLTGLLIGSLGLVASRKGPPRRLGVGTRAVAGAAVFVAAAFALVGYVGYDSLDRAQLALAVDNPQEAVSDTAIGSRWAPWSPYPLTVRGEALLRLNRVDAAQGAFRRAIDRDPAYWRAWLGLAVASKGPERRAAMRHAKALYPRSIEIEQTEKLLARAEGRSAAG
jgi:hypothetical protein